MAKLTARFPQGASEVRRYVIDYSAQLADGETVLTLVPTVITPQGASPIVVSSVIIASDGRTAAFFVSGGTAARSYEIDFLATTSIGQVLEDVVAIDIVTKV